MVERDQRLLKVLREYEDKDDDLRVSFRDGRCYDLNIISTMQAEEGGDVVADVIRVLQPQKPEIDWKDATMDFFLADVVRVDSKSECLFKETI